MKFFFDIVQTMLRRATPVLPAVASARPAATPVLSALPLAITRRVHFQESANRVHVLQEWTRSTPGQVQPLLIRHDTAPLRSLLIRNDTSSGSSVVRNVSRFRTPTHGMITHDEDGPLGSVQEHEFLGTIWIRTSHTGQVVRRSARIRQLKLNA